MRIVMDGTFLGAENGFGHLRFEEGKVYDTESDGDKYISHSLAISFVKQRKAHVQTDAELDEQFTAFVQAVKELVA